VNRSVQAAIFLVVSLSAVRAFAGNLDGVLASDYPNKIVTMRHFYAGDRLRFYADGTLVESAPAGTFTSDGRIEVRDANLQEGLLTVRGRRIYLVYDAKRKQLVDALNTIGDSPTKQQKEIEKTLRKRMVTVEIQMAPDPDPKEIPEALRAVFLGPEEPLTNIAPPYYRDFFAQVDGRSAAPQLPAGVLHVSSTQDKPGAVSAPHATFVPDPEYSEGARQLKLQGTVIVSLIVDPSGSVRDPQIAVPAGAGLDDQAIAAVRRWKFQPAQKDGAAVPVALSVEVDFRLY
jgi:TonB family protein